LETVTLKALAKAPQERYATARELADDLRRFLDHRPIRARRPSLGQRARKWARRHRAAVAAGAAYLLVGLVLLGGGIGWAARGRAAREEEDRRQAQEAMLRAEGQAAGALREAQLLLTQDRWAEALGAVRRAEAVLAGVAGESGLRSEAK